MVKRRKAAKRVMVAYEPISGLKPNLLISIKKSNYGAVTTGQPRKPIFIALLPAMEGGGDNSNMIFARLTYLCIFIL